jgi:BASS family bile acid:Na+ symporter
MTSLTGIILALSLVIIMMAMGLSLAITIAAILLNNPDYTIVPLIYGLLMFITASVLIIFRKRSKEVAYNFK